METTLREAPESLSTEMGRGLRVLHEYPESAPVSEPLTPKTPRILTKNGGSAAGCRTCGIPFRAFNSHERAMRWAYDHMGSKKHLKA